MKRIFSILTVLVVLFTVSSCNNELPEPTEQDYMSSVCTKDSVDEFLAIAKNMQEKDLLSDFNITEENLYNVTPLSVSEATDIKIFKDSASCASFILIDHEIYSICESFGGYGFINAVPCDFDGDGNTDLLVASSWGSGIHCSVISVFNTATKESTVVYSTSATERTDLMIGRATISYSSKDPLELPIYYTVYAVEIKVNDNNFANLSYVASDIIGGIEYENGTVVFKPVAK